MPRFEVDERGGIVAVIDTDVIDRSQPGLHSDHPWVLASWHGRYHGSLGHWKIETWMIEKAHHLARLLNTEVPR